MCYMGLCEFCVIWVYAFLHEFCFIWVYALLCYMGLCILIESSSMLYQNLFFFSTLDNQSEIYSSYVGFDIFVVQLCPMNTQVRKPDNHEELVCGLAVWGDKLSKNLPFVIPRSAPLPVSYIPRSVCIHQC